MLKLLKIIVPFILFPSLGYANCANSDWAGGDFSDKQLKNQLPLFIKAIDQVPVILKAAILSATESDGIFKLSAKIQGAYKGSIPFDRIEIKFPTNHSKPPSAQPKVKEEWILFLKESAEMVAVEDATCGRLGFPTTQRRLMEILESQLCPSLEKTLGLEMKKSDECVNDDDCVVTRELRGKIFCGDWKPVKKGFNSKDLLLAIRNNKLCVSGFGGSCLSQDLSKSNYKLRCIDKRCTVSFSD